MSITEKQFLENQIEWDEYDEQMEDLIMMEIESVLQTPCNKKLYLPSWTSRFIDRQCGMAIYNYRFLLN